MQSPAMVSEQRQKVPYMHLNMPEQAKQHSAESMYECSEAEEVLTGTVLRKGKVRLMAYCHIGLYLHM